MKYLYLLLLAALFLRPSAGCCCGYGFVGGCSTSIGLRINGTADSFSVAPCPDITAFNGLRLGNIQSLSLVRAKSINWESCQNNVTAVSLYFRVYQTGTPGGAWQMMSLQENYNTLAGPYTTRYRSANANANLVNGLVIGKDYTLEAYFRAEIDTIGDDFIPETFLLQNNNGANYHLSFRYGGPAAPPFTVVETKKSEPSCFGEANGNVSVAVYGNQFGLFYQWSNGNNNFFAQYNLAAGTYAVTVTGSSGYGQADTIQLGQPSPISSQFTNLVPLGCNNGTGQVTIQANGGTGPYTYHWNNGQTGTTLTVNAPGNYTVTVTDSNGCSQVFAQFIPGGSAPVSQNIAAEICQGEVYSRNNQSFSQSGDYSFTLPGITGCDTVVYLHLSVLDAGVLVSDLPAGIALTCGQPEQSLCATFSPAASYSWKKDGLTIGSMPCILATASGTYQVMSILTGNNNTCTAEKTIQVEEHFETPGIIATVVSASSAAATDGSLNVLASGGAAPYTYLWNTGSTSDQLSGLAPGTFCVTVTDHDGCSRDTCLVVSYTVATHNPALENVGLWPNPCSVDGILSVRLPQSFVGEPISIEIFDILGACWYREIQTIKSDQFTLKLPKNTPAGLLLVLIHGKNGAAIGRFMAR